MELGRHICMDKIQTHQKRLWFDDDGLINEGEFDLTIMTKWEVIKKEIFES